MKEKELLKFFWKDLSRKEKASGVLVFLFQQVTWIIDLVWAIVFGFVSVSIIAFATGISPSASQSKIVSVLPGVSKIDSFTDREVILLLLTAGVILHLIRSVWSYYISKFQYNLINGVVNRLSDENIERFFYGRQVNNRDLNVNELNFILHSGLQTGIQQYLGGYFQVLNESLIVIALVSFLAFIDFASTVVFVILGAAFLVFNSFVIRKKLRLLGRVTSETNMQLFVTASHLHEYKKQLRLFGTLDEYASRYGKLRDRYLQRVSQISLVSSLGKSILEILAFFSIPSIVLYVAIVKGAQEAAFQAGLLVAVLSRIIPSILRIVSLTNSLSASHQGVELYISLRNELRYDRVELKNCRRNELEKRIDNSHPRFEARDVSYFLGERSILSNVNLYIGKGEFIAICGYSGAGKSTLIQLLLGFIPPTSGNITINNCHPSDWVDTNPDKIALLPQENLATAGNPRDLILLGRTNISDLQISKMVSRFKLGSFGDKSDAVIENLETLEVSRLSGGEKQRLSIIQSLLGKPKVLIWDEPDNSLDSETETIIKKILISFKGTRIVVTHNPGIYRLARIIAFIDQGGKLHVGEFAKLKQGNRQFRAFVEDFPEAKDVEN